MAARDIPEGTPAADETVYSVAEAADWAGRGRQAIDAAIGKGRLKAHRWPGKATLWIRHSDLIAVYKPRLPPDLQSRLRTLEQEVADLTTRVTELTNPTTGPQPAATPNAAEPTIHPKGSADDPAADELANLRADNATLRAVNQLLLAEAADREDEDEAIDEAMNLMHKAIKKQKRAQKAIRKSRAKYRDALAHTQLPRHGPTD